MVGSSGGNMYDGYKRRTELFIDDAAQLTSAVYQLEGHEIRVFPTCNTAMGNWTLKLPSPALWTDRIMHIRATVANSKAITLADAGDDGQWSDLTLDTDGDNVVLWSDGSRAHVLVNGIA